MTNTQFEKPSVLIQALRMQGLHLFTAIPYYLAWSHYREGGNYEDGLYLAALLHALVFLGTVASCLIPRHLLAPSPLDMLSIRGPSLAGSMLDRDEDWQISHGDGFCFNPANGRPMLFGSCGLDTNGNSYGSSLNDEWS